MIGHRLLLAICALDLAVGMDSEGHVPQKNLRNAADEDNIDSNFMFIVRTANSPVQIMQGTRLQSQLVSQGVSKERVRLLHEVDHSDPGENSMPGYWTLATYLRELADPEKKTMAKWYVFVEPNTVIETEQLKTALSGYKHTESHFVGKKVASHGGITQSEQAAGYPMPFAASGFALSYGLVHDINVKLKAKGEEPTFWIDIFFELATLIKRLTKVEIVNNEHFCSSEENASCAIKPGRVAYEVGPHPVDPNDGMQHSIQNYTLYTVHHTVVVVVKTSYHRTLCPPCCCYALSHALSHALPALQSS
jgi:hypothetical protein